ncbi:hypothetical protein F909_00967 [Acinetobacter sp. ANC 3929]|uniref:hypothetical protein n=1 Tax=Acinetobacter sp. ANC 3929 TaxID=1217707 RepID=UPI0002D0172B|nr:hypothetical protein [Acinetobacter sp. ANC 3929]ENW82696.1 hypothetical protein F909_00967 [Acinetobacter sp. ANC 3929]
MMNYFKNNVTGKVHAFPKDGSQNSFITKDMKKMTKSEVDRHFIDTHKNRMPPLNRRQFMLTLVEYDLDDALKIAIAAIEDPKQRKLLEIEFNESQIFDRSSESFLKMANLLQLDETRINELWDYGVKL